MDGRPHAVGRGRPGRGRRPRRGREGRLAKQKIKAAPGAVGAAHPPAARELVEIVAANLKRLRLRRGHSLEGLAKLSGVSRAMISQVEQAKSTPTIGLLWKLSSALDVPFAALTSAGERPGIVVLRAAAAKTLSSADGKFISRALFPFDSPRKVEFYALRLRPGGVEKAEAHAPGTIENLIVARGNVEITVGGDAHRLGEGDAILFEADKAHSYRNAGAGEARMYLVMSYVEQIG